MTILRRSRFSAATARNRWLIQLASAFIIMTVVLSGCSGDGDDTPTPQVTEAAGELSAATSSEQPTPLTLMVDTTIPTPTPTTASVPTTPPTIQATIVIEPTPDVVDSQLGATIDALLESEDGLYGVVVLAPGGEYLYARNANVPFVAASLYKLVLLADIYARIENGTLALSDAILLRSEFFEGPLAAEDSFFTLEDEGAETTLEQALFATGAYSSNIAAKALLDLTSIESLRQTAESLGMWNTWFNVVPSQIPNWPDLYLQDSSAASERAVTFIDEQAEFNLLHLTTPNDVARYWQQLLAGEVVSSEASAAILDILRQQVVVDRIPHLLPEGMESANKTGNLYHVVHDTGIIFTGEGAVVLAVLSQGESDDDHGAQVIQRIALAAIGITDIPAFTVDHFATPE